VILNGRSIKIQNFESKSIVLVKLNGPFIKTIISMRLLSHSVYTFGF
jgi:hypothetical protein